MKKQFQGTLWLGATLFLLGAFGFFKNFLGITWHCGLICLDIDTLLIRNSITGIICSYIAYKKNRNSNTAFFVGLVFSILGILYYWLSKAGISEKEKELHDWEIQKKYQQMMKEKMGE